MEEYDQFSMYNRSEAFRQQFLGINEQRYYLDYLNPNKYYILSRNKYVAHTLMQNAGIRKEALNRKTFPTQHPAFAEYCAKKGYKNASSKPPKAPMETTCLLSTRLNI